MHKWKLKQLFISVVYNNFKQYAVVLMFDINVDSKTF